MSISSNGQSQLDKDQNEAIESLVKKYMDSLNLAGVSVSVIHKNELSFKKSFGYANLEFDVPMTNNSVYRVWSISKQFCAVSILKLANENLIDLEKPLSTYLDSIPETWEGITTKQLLNHTAGVRDYLNDYPEGKKLHSREYESIVDSIAILKFSPGSGWSYSNSNYWILTKIIEKVSGKTYQTYLKETFFGPLGMSNTQKMDYYNIIKNRVSGYRNVKGVLKNSTRYLDENHLADGDGEMISTNNDLGIWTKALFSGKLIDLDYLKKAWECASLNNGEKVDASSIIYHDKKACYGMGWFISELAGYKTVWTPGAGRGFSTTSYSVPDAELNIIVLCNARRFLIADKIAKRIAHLILNEN